ncbi:MAG TPA: TPM domain-containing protein [Granulicella sp.]|jgi:uncharacterized protein|nr:TPM domain-containing protein [Granulicella sp.]
MSRITRFVVAVLLLLPLASARAEQVAKLPAPNGYVSDFAGVLSPETIEGVDNLLLQLDRQAHAQIAVVTVKTIEGDDGSPESVEEFATALEDKWKVGAKGTDRGVLMLFVMSPMKGRIEVGYGLEGILNDAKVGDIGRSMAPAARAGNYNAAVSLGVQEVAQVIDADAGVPLQSPQMHRYPYRQAGQPVQLSLWQVVIGGGVLLLVLVILVSTGNAGWIFFLLLNMLGGSGGGGGRWGGDDRGGRGDGDGGGFGGFGGGSSGGGGASGDW